MAERKRGLGRGLDALIPQAEEGTDAAVGFALLALDEIKPNPSQPLNRTPPGRSKQTELALFLEHWLG